VRTFMKVWRGLRSIWRFILGVGCVLNIVDGVMILSRGASCPAVQFVQTPKAELLECVPYGVDGGLSARGMAGLFVVPSLALLWWVSRHFVKDMWYRYGPDARKYTVTPTFDLPPARTPVVVPGASKVCPWCAEPVDLADIVCRSCNGALPQLRGAVPPPADEWGALKAVHPHAFGPVFHSVEQIPRDQWPADAHAAIDRACTLFTTAGMNANRAVQLAFEEAVAGAAAVTDQPVNEPSDRGDDPPAPSLPPRLPPR